MCDRFWVQVSSFGNYIAEEDFKNTIVQQSHLKVKEKVLKISPNLIKKYSAEFIQVTEEMIKKGKKIFKSDIYISCTGLLKKGGSESKQKPVGTFFYCIDYKNKSYIFRKISWMSRHKAKKPTQGYMP